MQLDRCGDKTFWALLAKPASLVHNFPGHSAFMVILIVAFQILPLHFFKIKKICRYWTNQRSIMQLLVSLGHMPALGSAGSVFVCKSDSVSLFIHYCLSSDGWGGCLFCFWCALCSGDYWDKNMILDCLKCIAKWNATQNVICVVTYWFLS